MQALLRQYAPMLQYRYSKMLGTGRSGGQGQPAAVPPASAAARGEEPPNAVTMALERLAADVVPG